MAVNKTKDGIWYFKVDWKDSRGRQQQTKKQSVKWKKSDAQKAEREFILSLDKRNSIVLEMTYGEFYDLYKTAIKEELQERSFNTYDDRQRSFILPKFKDVPLSAINKRTTSDWQNWLLMQQTPKGQPYSNNYLKVVQSCFKAVLSWAVDEGYLKESPFRKKNVLRKGEKKKAMKFWTPGEFQSFYGNITDLQDQVTFRILFWCGLRKGELIGLNIEDYDPIDKTIAINKQWDTRNKKMTPPKNKRGYRTISVDTETARLIEDLIGYYRRCAGYRLDAPLISFTKRLPAQTLDNRKDKYIKLSGVKEIRIHDFRHSHASYLINQGFDPIDIAARLGHTVKETMDRYGHLYPDRQDKMAQNIDQNHENKKNRTLFVHFKNEGIKKALN